MPPAAPWPQIHGWLEGLIAAWGPFAVFWGCFFEGETAAMLGGLVMSGLVMALRNGALRWHDQMIEQAEAA